ncbi:hypothetical protein L208DRAFT_1280643, partial [Tricholoma matsutake]
RGVHDVFHASYLRVHQPNDNRLFPGWLDTQLGSQDALNGKWAVEHIEHIGTRNDVTFKVRWRSGNITWMLYYQIEHLHALESYFELLGIKQIYELPRSVNSNMFQPKIDSEGSAMNNLLLFVEPKVQVNFLKHSHSPTENDTGSSGLKMCPITFTLGDVIYMVHAERSLHSPPPIRVDSAQTLRLYKDFARTSLAESPAKLDVQSKLSPS